MEFFKSESTNTSDNAEKSIKDKTPSEMTIKELKLAINNCCLTKEAFGFSEKREYVQLLETHLIKRRELAPDQLECPVCLLEINISMKSVMLPCNHIICNHCFTVIHNRAYLGHPASNDKCPLCRTPLPQNSETLSNEALSDIGNVIMLHHQYSEADRVQIMMMSEEKIRTVLRSEPENIMCLTTLADLISDRDEMEEAFSLCRRAIIADPTLFYGYATISNLYKKTNDFKNALHCIEHALACCEANELVSTNSKADVINSMASLQFQMGNIDGAVLNHRRSKELTPDDVLCNYNLAVTLDECNVDIDEAILLYERALQLDEYKTYQNQILSGLQEAREKKKRETTHNKKENSHDSSK